MLEDTFQNWNWFPPSRQFAPRAFRPGTLPWQAPESQWAPRVDVTQRNGDIVLRAEVPGVDPERDIEVHLEDDSVTIRGQRRQEVQTQDERLVRVETNYGAFERTVPLPAKVNPENVRASYRNGILEVAIPRPETSERSRRIPIQAEGTNGKRRQQPSGTAGTASASGTPARQRSGGTPTTRRS